MIIVKTSRGDVFVNEKNMISLEHDKKNKCALHKYREDDRLVINNVESVLYSTLIEEYKSEGSEVLKLKAEIKELSDSSYKNRRMAVMYSDKVNDYDYFVKSIGQAINGKDLTLEALLAIIKHNLDILNDRIEGINKIFKETEEVCK